MTHARDLSSGGDAAIAVVGMALRFPGAPDVRTLWDNLAAGVESIARGAAPNGHVAAAGVVDGIELFDAAFFGCTPRQAAEMDPQHRLFLECAWSALEAAGHAPRGEPMRAGVYAGAGFSTYLLSQLLPAAEAGAGGVLDGALGFAPDYLATRVAYELDLTGPALTVQTACSTSLVAIHLACQALIAGECELALAGGASVRVPQLAPYPYQEGGILSPDGHCRAFDARGAGTVPGNGAGVVVLRRLADAIADRDPIRAVVLGTAINNDGGGKAGFTAPSVAGQARAIGEALAIAGVAARDIGYVEAHGTATPLGDPIELAALGQVFAGAPRGSCGIGSVKTNLGHLDAAAGVAGFIKAVLALEHGVLPPSLHFTSPNPQLGLDDSPFYVVAERRAWAGPRPRRAGVSSFGLGGTNAHAVLQEPPALAGDPPRRRDELLVISARTDASLERMAADLADHLRDTGAPLADIAHTLQVGRARFAVRRFAVGDDRRALAEALLRAGAAGPRGPGDEAGERDAVFVIPGSGVQRPNMAAELRGEPAFDEAFTDCAERARGLVGIDLPRIVFPAPGELDAMARALDGALVSQVAIFACNWAIARQWLAWGVAPAALLGHSLGEYVAACLAGVFSPGDALRLVAARGQILERLPPSGMISVLASAEQIAPMLHGELAIAAINGPGTCVVSGALAALEDLEGKLHGANIELRRLRYARATHSPLLDPHLAAFERLVAACPRKPPGIPMVSAVTGTWLLPEQATDPGYWRRQLRDPVRFSDALAAVLSPPPPGRCAVIEVGPGGTLSALVRRHPAAAGHAVVTTFAPSTSAEARPRRPLEALGEAWQAGVAIDWERFRAGERRCRVPLPTYRFDRRRYWIEAPDARPIGPASSARRAAAEPVPQAPPASRPPHTTGPAAAAPRDATERAILACFRELFHIGDIGIHDDFFALGGDSLLAVRLAAAIARRLDHPLAPKAIAEAATVAALAERLAKAAPPAELAAGCLVRLQDGGGAPSAPIFFVHGGGGHALGYRDLARAIDPDRRMYGFAARGLDDDEPCHASVEDMASHYAELARAVHPDGPYLLVGASFGGMIAYEMARRLTARGHAVPLCALVDAPGPSYLPEADADDADLLAFYLGRAVAIRPEALRGLTLDEQLHQVLGAARRAGAELHVPDIAHGRRLVRVWKNNAGAMLRYTAPPWPDGEVQFFAAAEACAHLPPHLERAWIGRCAVRVEVTPGDHHTMTMPPHAAVLGARIRRWIDDAAPTPRAEAHLARGAS